MDTRFTSIFDCFASVSPSLSNYPHITEDKKGIHISAEYIGKLWKLKKIPFIHTVNHGILDLNTVYKWPYLQQTGYKINLNPAQHKIIGSKNDGEVGVIYKTNEGMNIKDIEIKFDNEITTEKLIDYMGRKKTYLDILLKRLPCDSAGGYEKLGSDVVSKLLSCQSDWDNRGNIKGSCNIFESRELLDQLVISVLFLHARFGRGIAHEILLALLYDRIKHHVERFFGNLDKRDIQNLLGDTIRFTIEVIQKNVYKIKGAKDTNDNCLKDFIFEPNTKQSFRHWLVGESFSDVVTKNGWHPKIKKYFSDYLLPRIGNLDKSILYHSYEDYENLEDEFDVEDKERTPNLLLLQAQKELVFDKLSETEKEVLEMYVEGLTGEEIGRELSIKKARVSQIISGIRKKMRKD